MAARTMNTKLLNKKESRWGTTCLGALLLLLTFTSKVMAADVTLNFISFTTLPDDGVEIHLTFSDAPPEPKASTSPSPAAITLNLESVGNNLPWSLPLPIEVGAALSVAANEAGDNTKVVINLSALVAYETRSSGNSIYVTLSNSADARASAEGDASTQIAEDDTPPAESDMPSDMPAEDLPADAPPMEADMQVPDDMPLDMPADDSAPMEPEMLAETDMPVDQGAELKDISFSSLPGDRAQLILHFNNPPAKPTSFTIDDPARIALDFPATQSSLPWRTRNIGIGLTRSVTAVESGGRTRVVINLVKLLPYETRVDGNTVAITLKSDLAQTTSRPRGGISLARTSGPSFRLDKVDFRRGENGEGRVIVALSEPGISIDTREQGGRIVVDFANTDIVDELIQRLDVLDFATPVQYIDISKADDQVHMVITPSGLYEFLAFQSDNTFTIEVQPLSKEDLEAKKKADTPYSGETLSLNFQDIEVRAVLQLLADFTGLNMVTSDSVSGNLTLRLQNVPWDQALDIILKTKGLAMRTSGNVLMVAPQEEIAAREQLELESKKSVEELAPLQSELIQVNYAKAKDLGDLIQSDENSMTSERGKVTVDERTNTLLVLETSERIDNIRKLVTTLDVPVRQVLIESRIVVANNDFAKDLGVRFGVTGIRSTGNELMFSTGSSEGTDTMWSSYIDDLNSGGTGQVDVPSGEEGVDQRMNVNMPLGGNAGSIAFAILGSNTLLDLELSALQTEGRGEVISSPRIITSNQAEAVIKQGTEVPFQEASSSGATSVSFKEAVLSLTVTPHITPDDRIRMDLAVTKDSIGQVVPTSGGGSAPSIDTREISTQVLVASGETVVLGGIHEQARRTSVAKVPFFGDLPFVGNLFRTKRKSDNNSELLIFVTPKILKESFRVN